MNFLGQEIGFWAAAVIGTVLKIILSPFNGWLRTAITVVVALAIAYYAKDPILDIFNLNPEVYSDPVTALLALTGEGLARAVIEASMKPQSFLVDILKRLGAK